MAIQLFYAPEIDSNKQMPDEEAGHIHRVLRMQVGDPLQITDGKGCIYDATIASIDRKRCSVELGTRHEWQKPWQGQIQIVIAPTKQMERMEWMLEKLVEIGVDTVHFVQADHSERKQIRLDRLERIAISAMKQSGKALLPKLSADLSLKSLIAQSTIPCKMIAYVDESLQALESNQRLTPANYYSPGQDSLILIGPEGDFSPSELELALSQGYQPISLGGSRLRSETAAVVACHWLHVLQGIATK